MSIKTRKMSHHALTSLTFAFLYVPLLVLLVFSFNEKEFPAPWSGFTWKWYEELFHSSHLWTSFLVSLTVALCSTILSVLFGVMLIFYAAQGGKIGRWLKMFYGNIVIPETVLAVSLLAFFTLLQIPLGFATLILAHTILGMGFVIPLSYARFLEIDKRLSEVSLLLGATPFQTFFKVTLPLLRSTLITTSLLVFIISFDDFILSYFCAGSSSQTLSLYVLSMLRSGVSPTLNALSAVLILFSSTMVLLFFSLRTRHSRIL